MGDSNYDSYDSGDEFHPTPTGFKRRERESCSSSMQAWIKENFGLYEDGPDKRAQDLRAENIRRTKRALGQ